MTVVMERDENGASIDAHDGEAVPKESITDAHDRDESTPVKTDENGAEMTAQQAETSISPSKTSDFKRKRDADGDDEEPTNESNECARQFSLAQVRVQVKRARLEANIAVQNDIKQLRFDLLKAEHVAQEREREKQQAEKRCEALQGSMDTILKMHQRTLNGMRDNLELETLVASLDKEKATKHTLQKAFQDQNAQLVLAKQSILSLEQQIMKYQKTETVLAQSISHFQDQYSSKDHERSATLDRVKRELEEQHSETRLALEAQVNQLVLERDALQVELNALKTEHAGLQETAQAVIEMQEKREAEREELLARVAQFDTEKAVLQSKVEQVQKADAQLRDKIHSQDEEIVQLKQDNELLRTENVELGKIASDLMDLAEQEHNQKQQVLNTPDKEGDERLAHNRKRLRESLG